MDAVSDAIARRNAEQAYQQVVAAREAATRDPSYASYYIACVEAYQKNYGHLSAPAPATTTTLAPTRFVPTTISTFPPTYATAAPVVPAAPTPKPTAPAPAYPAACGLWADAALRCADTHFPQGPRRNAARAQISAQVFAFVRSANENGTLWTRDWSREPLPEAGLDFSYESQPNDDRAWGSASGAAGSEGQPKVGKKRALAPDTNKFSGGTNSGMKIWSKGGGTTTTSTATTTMSSVSAEFAASMFTATGGAGVAEALSAAAEGGGSVDWSLFAVLGTCDILEKRFFRLIGAPDPAAVRPEPALTRTLTHLRARALENAPYLYLSDQLKSVRQDLVVQHIRGRLAVEVYEWHAQLALIAGDAAELSQCLVQLSELWALARAEGGARALAAETSELDFAAVRLVTSAHAGDASGAASILSTLPKGTLCDTRIRHALNVRAALSADNALRFFALKAAAQPLTIAAMEWCVARVRTRALAAIVKSGAPKGSAALPLDFIGRILGFQQHQNNNNNNSEGDDFITMVTTFVTSVGGVILNGNTLDLSASSIGAARETAAHEAEIQRAGLGLINR